MSTALGPSRPNKLTIWPVEAHRFGIDVCWSGAEGNRRVTVVRRLLDQAGIRARVSQGLDGRSW